MATTRWGVIAIALAALMRARTGWRDPDTRGTDKPFFLGPQYGAHNETAPVWLAIAWSGDPESPEDAGQWDQEVAGHAASNRPRNETGTLDFMVQANRGDTDFESAITDAIAALADMETAVRDDPYIGLGAASNTWHVQVVSGTPRLYFDQGAVCEIKGQLQYRARI